MSDTVHEFTIPFLQPRLPEVDDYLPYLRKIDVNHWYSNFGPMVQEFERRCLAQFFAGQGAVCTMTNCTLGLMLALRATARSSGRYVVMPSFTFPATAEAVKWAGLTPYFVDITPHDWTADLQQVEQLLATLGDEVAAVMPYATFGTSLDLAGYEAMEARGIPVIVDAAPGLGARDPYGQPFAAGFSGTVVFSMHATKPFGIGEGGLVYSSTASKIEKIRHLANFGFSESRTLEGVGLNAKLTEYMAAIGLAVLETYAAKIIRLHILYDRYVEAIAADADLSAALVGQSLRGRVPNQFMPVLLPAGTDTPDLEAKMDRRGIGTRRYFSPACHQHNLLDVEQHGSMAVTEEIASRILCLPLWDGMSADVPARVLACLAELLDS